MDDDVDEMGDTPANSMNILNYKIDTESMNYLSIYLILIFNYELWITYNVVLLWENHWK